MSTLEGQYTWEVVLQSPRGERGHNLNFFNRFSFTRNVGGLGHFSITLPLDEMTRLGFLASPVHETLSDRMISFWRGWPGTDNKEVFSGFVETIIVKLDTMILEGRSLNALLDRRIVAYDAGTAQAEKNAEIDDMMKAIVRENLGSLTTDTARIVSDLTIEPDATAGVSVTKSFSRDNVLEILQDLTAYSQRTKTTPVPIYFDIDRLDETAGYIFRTYPHQRGSDKSVLIAAFSVEMGTLEDPVYIYSNANVASVVYVGGQGEGETRTITEVEDATLSGLSTIGRREIFLNASHLDDDALEGRGDQALNEKKPREIVKGTLLNTPQARFQEQWNYGDKVSVYHAGRLVTVRINNLTVTINAQGQERITSSFETVNEVAS